MAALLKFFSCIQAPSTEEASSLEFEPPRQLTSMDKHAPVAVATTADFSFDTPRERKKTRRRLEVVRQRLGSANQIPSVRTDLTPRSRRAKLGASSEDDEAPRSPSHSLLHSNSLLPFHATELFVNRSACKTERAVRGGALASSGEEEEGGDKSAAQSLADGWSTGRCELQDCIDAELRRQLTPTLGPQNSLTHSRNRLKRRLQRLKLSLVEVQGDGNCQFRAISLQLFGSQDLHQMVRERTMSYLAEHEADYRDFVGSDDESFREYVVNMQSDKVWGDEVTLCCACEAFDCVINVITSEPDNWNLAYRPSLADARTPEIFLAYTFPLHYDAVGADGYGSKSSTSNGNGPA